MKNSEKKLMFGLLFSIMMDTTSDPFFGVMYGILAIVYLVGSMMSAAKRD